VASERLTTALSRIDGVIEAESAFRPGPGFWAGGKEIAHFDGPNAIDLRLTRAEIRARRAELRADPRIELRSSSSDWVTITIGSPADEDFVIGLAEVAAAAHRPPDGAAVPPPPTGADLARRRRFH
jgi:Family of unknown function (DUF5519)